jgi:hypothetical protein
LRKKNINIGAKTKGFEKPKVLAPKLIFELYFL